MIECVEIFTDRFELMTFKISFAFVFEFQDIQLSPPLDKALHDLS